MANVRIELTDDQLQKLAEVSPDDIIAISGGAGEGQLIGAVTGATLCFGTAAVPFCAAVGAYIGANIQAAGSSDIGGRQVSEIVGA